MIRDIDPLSQYLIYSSITPARTRITGESISSKKNLAEILNRGLKEMKVFFQDDRKFFSLIKSEEKKSVDTNQGFNHYQHRSDIKPVLLTDTCTYEELQELESKVKDDYGDSLVRVHHKKVHTIEDHEKAQLKAYENLDKKIKSGAVRPDSIQSLLLSQMELRNKPEVNVDHVNRISGHIAGELKEFTTKGFIKKDEAELILREAETFTSIYTEAFPDAEPKDVFTLVRDNARKLAFQTERDKHILAGSDHGTRHILEGNMKMADRMLERLGHRATAKDKVLIHQIIIDHDLGYSVGVVKAQDCVEAINDHPLFSAKFVGENKDYYIQKFGSQGYEMIKNGILMHSYPKSEYNTPTDSEKGFNPDMIRSITSTVDALGVTAETKCPALFRDPQAIKVIQKMQLYAESHDGKIPPEVLSKYKNALKKIADREPDSARRAGFNDAIESRLNTYDYIVQSTLGQYTGVLKDINLTERKGKIIPEIKMDISRSQALLGNIFGDNISTRAFVKVMEDLGVPGEKMGDMGKLIRQIKEAKTDEQKNVLMSRLRYESDKAVFEFGPTFNEINPEVQKVFEELERISIRQEIKELSQKLTSEQARTPDNITKLMANFRSSIGEGTDKEDLIKLMEIQRELQNNIHNPSEFEVILKRLDSFTTRQEREFMEVR